MNRTDVLPIWKTVGETYAFAVRHWWRLALMGLPFMILISYLDWPVESAIFGGPILIQPVEISVAGRVWRYVVLELQLQAMYAVPAAVGLVAIHRLALLGDKGPHLALPLRIGRREGRFLLVLAAAIAPTVFYDAVSLGLIFGTDLEDAVTLAKLLPALLLGAFLTWWLTLRLSLGLPPAALDGRHPLPAGWRMGRGNNVRLMSVITVAMGPGLLAYMGTFYADAFFTSLEFIEGTKGGVTLHLNQPVGVGGLIVVLQSAALWSVAALQAAGFSFSFRALCAERKDNVCSGELITS